jgi:hypothetical protein
MSLLPQRKKSPEEIAKLRESLGVPGFSAEENETSAAGPVDTVVPTHHAAIVEHHPTAAPPAGPSARRDDFPARPSVREAPIAAPAPKAVRSLRKSEQSDVAEPHPSAPLESSKLPVHRHSDEEIAEIRRRQALAMMTSAAPNPKLIPAHPAVITPGYLLALAGASCFFSETFPLAATAGCAAASLLVAALIVVRRPISRHHAAFIAIIALLVIVFGALHYFPHLRHAT